MNIKNNKRKRESIEKIEKAFVGLLQTHELHTITVSDICKIADLNRSTFYANYTDIYDLADKIRENLESDFNQLFEKNSEALLRQITSVEVFRHIKENQLLYKTYFKLGYDNVPIVGYDIAEAEKYFENKHMDYHIEFFRSGLNAIIKKWLSNNCKESPQEMAQIIISEYQGRI